jgi:hypothetical protein
MVALWLVIGAVTGCLIAGSTAKAQSSAVHAPSVIAVGEEVVLQFERGTLSENISSMRCAVLTVEENWAKCAVPDTFDPGRGQKWVNLAYVTQISRREK